MFHSEAECFNSFAVQTDDLVDAGRLRATWLSGSVPGRQGVLAAGFGYAC